MREGFGAPEQSLESGTQEVCPHFFRPLFLSRSRVSKMGPQNRPLAQPWCAKCPRLTDPHLVAYPCAAAIARRHRATHLLADLTTHTRRGTVAFKLVEAGSCVCSQPALPLVAASPCVRERVWGAKRDETAWRAHMCDLELRGLAAI